jgi:hypothetical protein
MGTTEKAGRNEGRSSIATIKRTVTPRATIFRWLASSGKASSSMYATPSTPITPAVDRSSRKRSHSDSEEDQAEATAVKKSTAVTGNNERQNG